MCRIICIILHAHLLLMNLQIDGVTPLLIAAQKGRKTIVAALLSHPTVDVNNARVCTSCICNNELLFDEFGLLPFMACVA